MNIDVQVNLIEPVGIVVSDKGDGCDRLVGVEFGMGSAQILLSIDNAAALAEKLGEEVARQKSLMVGEGALRVLGTRDWVNRITVKPFEDQVSLMIEAVDGAKVDLELKREIVGLGMLLGKAADVLVSAHVVDKAREPEEGETEIYLKPAKEEPAAAAADC